MATEKRWHIHMRTGKSFNAWGNELDLFAILETDRERIEAMEVGETYEDNAENTWERKQ